MSELGTILIADDEKTFLDSTADLLRREGYECDCVSTAEQGIAKIRENRYDLLVSDIKMPGNPNLELIKQLTTLAPGMPAILVTGFPSRSSAIESIQLPVVAYMVKPIDFNELLQNVTLAMGYSRLGRTIDTTKQRLMYWHQSLTELEDTLKTKNKTISSTIVKKFLDITFANVAATLADIKNTSPNLSADTELLTCPLLNCPRLDELEDAVEQTVDILHKTKASFKSKELGLLRKQLEEILKKNKKNNAKQKPVRYTVLDGTH